MKLATRTVGEGSRSAALVHGASMSSDAWREFVPYLLELDLTLTLVDLRGHGDSPRADSYRIDEFVDDLVDTLPQGLDLLIGQSLGGLTAAWAAPLLKPKRFIGIDPAFSIDRKSLFLLRLLGPIQPKLPDFLLRRLGLPPKGSPPDMLARIHAMWAKWDTASVRDVTKSAAEHPFPAGPPSVPSTIVLADPSTATPPAFADALRTQGWDVRVIAGGGHDLHQEDPGGLAEVLRDVLVAR
ncbi:alpha/beta fold hydrolase [Frondihabitans cladoniiphilus]|uniref:Alpha/beta hydrolase n=1 Tax=Frondihabitans cladoniiphilus TaxID=715785 RepID=A0ABP8VQE2_9MICO